MITYVFNKELGILETTFEKEVSIKDITEYIIMLSEDMSLPKELKILTNATKGKFSIGVNPKDLIKLSDANKKSLAKREYIYDAFILTGSFEIALGMLYKTLSKTKKYRFNVFSTQKAALEWLRI